MKYRVSVEREGCISDAICTALCRNFVMDDSGKATVVKDVIDESEYLQNHEAEVSCPTGVIRITKI
ncbi:MAG: ferredoxin [Thermoplasmataceae archaeon]